MCANRFDADFFRAPHAGNLRAGCRCHVDALGQLLAALTLRIAAPERSAVRTGVNRLPCRGGVDLASRAIHALTIEAA